MTKQNVTVSDARSGISLAMSMAVSNSTVFAQKPPAAPGGYISISRKKLLKNLEINGAQRINSWVDSMRASSPTHIKSTPPSLTEDHSSWMVSQDSTLKISLFGQNQPSSDFSGNVGVVYSKKKVHHPSALDMFEQIIDASKGKQIVMFLDYDGTLSPIVDDPDRAFMSDKVSLLLLPLLLPSLFQF